MKRIIFVVFLLSINFIYTQERSVSIEETVERNGLTYVLDEGRPFTGTEVSSDGFNPLGENINFKSEKYTTKWIRYYKDGILDKISIIYYSKGKIWARGNYNGKKGETIFYFDNERVSERINYIDNRLNGERIIYSPTGKVLEIINYKNGERIN